MCVYGRYLYETNPYAQGAVGLLADYTIGTGFEYFAVPKRGARASKPLLKMVDKFYEDFGNANKWWEYEREYFVRAKRDGDVFVRFFPQDSGVTQTRAVEPEQVRNPTGSLPRWSFGILTDQDDHIDKQAYHLWYDANSNSGETVRADKMLMFQNHTDRNVKRGLGDFFCVQDILEDAAKLCQAGRQGEAVRQAIAYVRQWATANAGAITSFGNANTDYTQIVATNNGTPRLQNVQQVTPGAVLDIQQGLEFQQGPQGNATNADMALSYTLKCAAVKWRIPHEVLTGETGSFAGMLVKEAPLTKRVEWDQHRHKMWYRDVYRKAMEIGVEQGVLPEEVLEKVDVGIECPAVAARDPKNETDINKTLVDNKVMSRRSWASRENLDFEQEQEQIKAEEEAGLAPPVVEETKNGGDGPEETSNTSNAQYLRGTGGSRRGASD